MTTETVSNESDKIKEKQKSSCFAYQAKVFQAAKFLANENDNGHLQMRWYWNSDGEIVIDSLVRVHSSLPYVLYVDVEKESINSSEDDDSVVLEHANKRPRLLISSNDNNNNNNNNYDSISRQLENVEFNCCSELNYQSDNEDWTVVIDLNMFSGNGLKTINRLIKAFNVKLESERFYRIGLRQFSSIVVDTVWCGKGPKPAKSFVLIKNKEIQTTATTTALTATTTALTATTTALTPNKDQANIVRQLENILNSYNRQTTTATATQNVILVNSVAGSGKTTTLHFLKHRNVLYLATTKKLVAEAYGVKAQTICKFLMSAFRWSFIEYVQVTEDLTTGNSEEKTLNCDQLYNDGEMYDIIFIDEVSLIPSALLRELTRIAVRMCKIVLLVGDVNQLSAIGAYENDLYNCLSYVDRVLFIKQHMRSNDPNLIKLLRQFEAGDVVNEGSLKSLKCKDINLTKLFHEDGSFKDFKFISKFNSNVLLINMALIKLRSVLFKTDTYFERCYVKDLDDERLSENDVTVALQVGAPYVCLSDTCKPKGSRFRLKKINRKEERVVSVVIEDDNEKILLTLYRSFHQYTLYGREHVRFGFPLLLDLAVSTHRCQGSTFTGLVFIEMDNMSRSEGYVCLSRATSLKNLQLL